LVVRAQEEKHKMLLAFKVGDTLVEFRRNWFTGNTSLTTPSEKIQLQGFSDISTHFSVKLTKSWSCTVSDLSVVIEKRRPLLLAGIRPQHYKVFIDGNLVLEQSGF